MGGRFFVTVRRSCCQATPNTSTRRRAEADNAYDGFKSRTHMDYRQAGVDIDAGNEVVRRIRTLAQSTYTPGVLSEIGSFGGLFRMDAAGMQDPVLVSSADGVGTKLKVAFMTGEHRTIGR